MDFTSLVWEFVLITALSCHFLETMFRGLNVPFLLQLNHVEHNTTVCQGEVYILDFNMAGRSEDESVSNSSGESR